MTNIKIERKFKCIKSANKIGTPLFNKIIKKKIYLKMFSIFKVLMVLIKLLKIMRCYFSIFGVKHINLAKENCTI